MSFKSLLLTMENKCSLTDDNLLSDQSSDEPPDSNKNSNVTDSHKDGINGTSIKERLKTDINDNSSCTAHNLDGDQFLDTSSSNANPDLNNESKINNKVLRNAERTSSENGQTAEKNTP